MAVGEHETIAVEPARIGWVVPQMPTPQNFGDLGHSHWHAGVTGVGVLNCIHCQRAQHVGFVPVRTRLGGTVQQVNFGTQGRFLLITL